MTVDPERRAPRRGEYNRALTSGVEGEAWRAGTAE
jgi:hypothetical protein